uniref:B-like cyclin n=1 Tax=Kalanchoe fedtschenkoi TaxID=63787 RepID=A0A7N1A6S9_KALFE
MATRGINPHNGGEENPLEGNKPQKENAPDAQNRRALGDIGNFVTVRGVDVKLPNRPVTRGFCAQLVANAQAKAEAENNKKLLDVPAPVAVNGAVVDQKKAAVNPKRNLVIEISPDSEEEVKMEERKKHYIKKKANSLTSVLTARSKAACGLTNKPKDTVVDIDADDAENELAAVEYVEDIYKFYKLIEEEIRLRDYMDSQPEINQKMRSILVDWLIEVHQKFELLPETLYLTVNIVDRFLAVKSVPRRDLQLVGISAMLMASKYEEIWAPEVNDFVCISDRAYSHDQILKMEKAILGHLEWTLTVATPYVFLVRFIKASIPDKEMEQMAHFLSELAMMHYGAAVMFCPSLVAASAVYAARCTLVKTPAWDATLQFHTGFSEAQLLGCAKLLVSFHSTAASADNKLKVVYRRYSNPERAAVALLSPAKSLTFAPSTC